MSGRRALVGVGADVLLALISSSSSPDTRESAVVDALDRAANILRASPATNNDARGDEVGCREETSALSFNIDADGRVTEIYTGDVGTIGVGIIGPSVERCVNIATCRVDFAAPLYIDSISIEWVNGDATILAAAVASVPRLVTLSVSCESFSLSSGSDEPLGVPLRGAPVQSARTRVDLGSLAIDGSINLNKAPIAAALEGICVQVPRGVAGLSASPSRTLFVGFGGFPLFNPNASVSVTGTTCPTLSELDKLDDDGVETGGEGGTSSLAYPPVVARLTILASPYPKPALAPQLIRLALSNPTSRTIGAVINYAAAATSPLALVAAAAALLLSPPGTLTVAAPIDALSAAVFALDDSATATVSMLAPCVSLCELIARPAMRVVGTEGGGIGGTPLVVGTASNAASASIVTVTTYPLHAHTPIVALEPLTTLGIFGALEAASGDTALSPLSPRRGVARIWTRETGGEVNEAVTALFGATIGGKSVPTAATLRLTEGVLTDAESPRGAVTIPLTLPSRLSKTNNKCVTIAGEGSTPFSYFSFSVAVDDASWRPRNALETAAIDVRVAPVCLSISAGGGELWRSNSLRLPGDSARGRVCITNETALTLRIIPLAQEEEEGLSPVRLVFPFLVFPRAFFETAPTGDWRSPRILSYARGEFAPFAPGASFSPPGSLPCGSTSNVKLLSPPLAASFILGRLAWLAELDAEGVRVGAAHDTERAARVGARAGNENGNGNGNGNGTGTSAASSAIAASSTPLTARRAKSNAAGAGVGGMPTPGVGAAGAGGGAGPGAGAGAGGATDIFLRAGDTRKNRASMALPATRAAIHALAVLVTAALAATVTEGAGRFGGSPAATSGSVSASASASASASGSGSTSGSGSGSTSGSGSGSGSGGDSVSDNGNGNGALDLRPRVEITYGDEKTAVAAADAEAQKLPAADSLRSVLLLSRALFARASATGIVSAEKGNCGECGGLTSSTTATSDFDSVVILGADADRLAKPFACCFTPLREALACVAAAGTGTALPSLRMLRALAASALDEAFSLTARDGGARRQALAASLAGGATLLFNLPALTKMNHVPPPTAAVLASSSARSSSSSLNVSPAPPSPPPQVTPTRVRKGWRLRNLASTASASPTSSGASPGLSSPPSTALSTSRAPPFAFLNRPPVHNDDTARIADLALLVQLEAARAGFNAEAFDTGRGIVRVRIVLPPTRAKAATRFVESGIARAVARAGLGRWVLPCGSALVPLHVERFEGAKGFSAAAGGSAAARLCLATGDVFDHQATSPDEDQEHNSRFCVF